MLLLCCLSAGILLWEVATGGKAFAGASFWPHSHVHAHAHTITTLHVALNATVSLTLSLSLALRLTLPLCSCCLGAAGIPKPLLGHCVVSQGMRPTWPSAMKPGGNSSSSSSISGGGAFGGGSGSDAGSDAGPWSGLVALTERCWAQEAQARWG